MVNIVLVEPRTSGNVGTIGRTAVAIGGVLHLIKPYGWGNDITTKEVKKAGLDYWDKLEWYQYENIEEFWEKNPLSNRHFFATTKTKRYYFEPKYNKNDYIYFGREDAGLPEDILNNNQETCINIPMVKEARSLNISNAVSVAVYEVVKQNINEFAKL
ncbi:MAG: tRNA (cytidine(34)-2'-O)-methyltransferase [Campylobacterota bacterium]|nr:tRNA (cytidine(34)-2'-O)-methyltransferase [Campylobacterota bacterium]